MSDISKAISTVFPDDKAHGFALLVPDKSSCETAMILFVQEIWSTFGMGEFLLPFFIYLFFFIIFIFEKRRKRSRNQGSYFFSMHGKQNY